MSNKDQEELTKAYRIYNILYWIKSKAPESITAKEAFNKFQKEYPIFKPREHPDLSTWSSGVQQILPVSPLSVEQIIEYDPSELTKLLLTFQDESILTGPNRAGLLDELTKAVKVSFNFSTELAKFLINTNIWEDDVWYSIIQGWMTYDLTAEKWKAIIDILLLSNLALPKIRSIGDILENTIEKKPDTIDTETLPLLEKFSDEYWESLINSQSESSKDYDWLMKALNNPAGRVVLFWVKTLSKKYISQDQPFPDAYKRRFEQVIKTNHISAHIGKTVLASQLNFLYYRDPEWTKNNLLPLFDWDFNKEIAEACWDGFLYWGKIPPGLIDDFKILLNNAFNFIPVRFNEKRDRVLRFVEGLIFAAPSLSLKSSWFYEILKKIKPEERKALLNNIKFSIRELTDKQKVKFWNEWLREYWEDRLDSIPVPLEKNEAGGLIELVPEFVNIFPETLPFIARTKEFELEHSILLDELKESQIIEKYPDETKELLIHIISKSDVPPYHNADFVNLYIKLKKLLSEADLRQLKEKLLERGCVLPE